MLSDIVIAQAAKMLPIAKVAEKLGLTDEDLIPYGRYKAKINHKLIHSDRPDGKLILMTAISPTPAGEGKTTTSVGLADALNAMGKKTMLCLREPSLGPVFGVKGGAAGGGYAQVVPMEDINLHFTGDIHAIGTANNLLAAMIDNSIQQGNPLNIDPRRITWKRCMDMNDRQLRFIVDGLGGKVNGTPREDGFDITVASEVMAIFCLATSISDLKERLSRIVCAYTYDGKPVTAFDPTDDLDRMEPVVTMLPGWNCDISHCTLYNELPDEAKSYIEFLEKQLVHVIQFVSTGAEREQYLLKGTWL